MNKKYIIIIGVILLFSSLYAIEKRYWVLDIFVANNFKESIDFTLRASTIDFEDVYNNVSFKSYVTEDNSDEKYGFETFDRIYSRIIHPTMTEIDYVSYFYESCLLDAWFYLMGLGYPERAFEDNSGQSNDKKIEVIEEVIPETINADLENVEKISEGKKIIVEVHPELYEVLCIPEEVRLYREVYKMLKTENTDMNEDKLAKQVRERVKSLKKKAFFNNLKYLNGGETNIKYKVVR